MTKRQKLKQNPAIAKKLDDAANTLLKYARTQLKRDQLIDDNELETFCYKPAKDLATAEEIIEGMVKKLDKLINGSASHSTATAYSHPARSRNARQEMRTSDLLPSQRHAARHKATCTRGEEIQEFATPSCRRSSPLRRNRARSGGW